MLPNSQSSATLHNTDFDRSTTKVSKLVLPIVTQMSLCICGPNLEPEQFMAHEEFRANRENTKYLFLWLCRFIDEIKINFNGSILSFEGVVEWSGGVMHTDLATESLC